MCSVYSVHMQGQAQQNYMKENVKMFEPTSIKLRLGFIASVTKLYCVFFFFVYSKGELVLVHVYVYSATTKTRSGYNLKHKLTEKPAKFK